MHKNAAGAGGRGWDRIKGLMRVTEEQIESKMDVLRAPLKKFDLFTRARETC